MRIPEERLQEIFPGATYRPKSILLKFSTAWESDEVLVLDDTWRARRRVYTVEVGDDIVQAVMQDFDPSDVSGRRMTRFLDAKFSTPFFATNDRIYVKKDETSPNKHRVVNLGEVARIIYAIEAEVLDPRLAELRKITGCPITMGVKAVRNRTVPQHVAHATYSFMK